MRAEGRAGPCSSHATQGRKSPREPHHGKRAVQIPAPWIFETLREPFPSWAVWASFHLLLLSVSPNGAASIYFDYRGRASPGHGRTFLTLRALMGEPC